MENSIIELYSDEVLNFSYPHSLSLRVNGTDEWFDKCVKVLNCVKSKVWLG